MKQSEFNALMKPYIMRILVKAIDKDVDAIAMPISVFNSIDYFIADVLESMARVDSKDGSVTASCSNVTIQQYPILRAKLSLLGELIVHYYPTDEVNGCFFSIIPNPENKDGLSERVSKIVAAISSLSVS